jgi:sulfate transport system ATP-binding protein
MKQLRNFIKLLSAISLTGLSGMLNAQSPQTYVRPHDIEVQPYVETSPIETGQAPSQGLVAQLTRAIVVGPTARLELVRWRDSDASVIEVQIPASQYQSLGFKEGQLLVLTPKRARVFVEGSSPLVTAPSSQSPSPS